jgi:hypothetical protein
LAAPQRQPARSELRLGCGPASRSASCAAFAPALRCRRSDKTARTSCAHLSMPSPGSAQMESLKPCSVRHGVALLAESAPRASGSGRAMPAPFFNINRDIPTTRPLGPPRSPIHTPKGAGPDRSFCSHSSRGCEKRELFARLFRSFVSRFVSFTRGFTDARGTLSVEP